MTAAEILNKFNLHYNNILSDTAPGLTSYEISLFLTKAHKELVYSYYLGIKYGSESFESTAKVKELLAPYISTKTIVLNSNMKMNNFPDSTLDAYLVDLGEDILAIISEFATSNSVSYRVKPIIYDIYLKILNNPYKRPSDQFIWRLDGPVQVTGGPRLNTKQITLVADNDLSDYSVTYIINPNPIILGTFDQLYESKIEDSDFGESIPEYITPIMWDLIIDRAVELATRDYKENSLSNQVSLNQRIQ